MRNLKRNVALVGATGVIAAAGLGGVMSAQANTSTSGTPSVQNTEAPETGAADDGPNQGPDANPSEPGHQDADESGDAQGTEGTGKGAEKSGTEDGPDQGPDANPNEPGHQDADGYGETG
jgi:hypothetical protein